MLLRIILLAAALPGAALASDRPADPPPAGAQGAAITDGTVARFTLAPDGRINGLLLDNGTEVQVPPHLADQLLQAVRPGDNVHVQGWRTPTPGVLDASSLTDARSGRAVVVASPAAALAPATPARRDRTTPRPLGLPPPGAQETTRSGRVLQLLHDAGGMTDGALLGDGMELRMPARAAAQVAPLLQPGTKVTAQGYALETPYGAVMAVQAIGASAETLTQVAPGPAAPAPGRPPGQ
ncbi:MAG TPA: hypothetical protein VFN46_07580 [Acetobacteraceae bacterium]|nr:hypothetical protein [Acetobacteraceae bacterium]